MTVRRLLGSLVLTLAWLAVAALVAFGAAGVVTAMNRPPGTLARPELTWSGDRAAEPALDLATSQLQRLSGDMDAIGSTARQALASVVAGDLEAVDAMIATGTTQLAVVRDDAARLAILLEAVPGIGPDGSLRLSDGLLRRYDELATTPDLTSGLAEDWAAFTGRALDAAGLTALLTRHDAETAAAAREGSAAHYQKALQALDKSDATIAEARARQLRLATTTDVSTLATWLDRNAAYDAALRNLYESLLSAKGRITDAVRAAFVAEQAARAQLPGDTRGLVVIMVDIAQGGLNQAVISIEQARGSLAAALDVQRQLQPGPLLPE